MLDATAGPLREASVNGVVEECGRGVAIIGGPIDTVVISGRYNANRGEGIMVSNANGITIVDAEAIGNGRADLLLQGKQGAREVSRVRTKIGRVLETGASGNNWISAHPLA